MATSGAGAARIFISYRRADASWPTRWLADWLTGQFGAGVVFQDVDSIPPGDDFAADIEAEVGACSVLLAVIGPRWLAAEGDAGWRLDDPQDLVRLEIEAAITRGVRVIPVLVDGARMPSASELPPSLQGVARIRAVALSTASLDTRSLMSLLETALAPEKTGQRHTGMRVPESPRPARDATSRLLMSAVHDASTLVGEEKAIALSAVVGAAIAVAPERAAGLAAEAETAARSIEDPDRRSGVLSGVAKAVAAADPDRAEAVARAIEDPGRRWDALVSVAVSVAAVDPDRAEAVARAIEDPVWRLQTLADLARLLAHSDR